MNHWLHWQPGRQPGVAYRKMLLARIAPWFDAWLIDYEAGTELPWHVDHVAGRKHWRLNVALLTGGAWTLTHERDFRRLAFFRSDRFHAVTRTTSRRLVLSFGFTRRQKEKRPRSR